MSRILLLTAHSIFEYDELRILAGLGHDVLSIGAYLDPAHPSDDKRPALPDIAGHPDLAKLVEGDQMAHKANLPDELIEWAEIIIVHFFAESWIGGQWDRIRHKRVIWRTCGQSHPDLETYMALLRPQGLQIVRYSPKEANIPGYAGQDALIRFSKDSADWYGWTGADAVVGNITQDMLRRGEACGLAFWMQATRDLPVRPAGSGSEGLGGVGALSYPELQQYLRDIRCYLYTGTQPAPYTLGLIEAMMTGTPVVSIGSHAFGGDSWLAEVFEAADIAYLGYDDPAGARGALRNLLNKQQVASDFAERERAIALFGIDHIAAQWRSFL